MHRLQAKIPPQPSPGLTDEPPSLALDSLLAALPLHGMLEQTVGEVLKRGMAAVRNHYTALYIHKERD